MTAMLDIELSMPEQPERTLVAAVLAKAVSDYDCKHKDAAIWFASADSRPFGFVWVCAILGLDPTWVRTKLQQSPAERRKVFSRVDRRKRARG